jgi:hypothetical protein
VPQERKGLHLNRHVTKSTESNYCRLAGLICVGSAQLIGAKWNHRMNLPPARAPLEVYKEFTFETLRYVTKRMLLSSYVQVLEPLQSSLLLSHFLANWNGS